MEKGSRWRGDRRRKRTLRPGGFIRAIIHAYWTRKDFLADRIIAINPKAVGVFRIAMKAGLNKSRQSSIQAIMKRIKAKGIDVVIYEPALHEDAFFGFKVLRDLAAFKNKVDVIVANRNTSELADVSDKVFTRDLFVSD